MYSERLPDNAQSNQWIAFVRLFLACAVLIHATGLFATVFSMNQTHFGNYLFMVLEYPHGQAVFIEKISVSILLALSIVNIFHTRAYTLLPIAGYVFFEAWAGYYQAGFRYSDYAMFTQALRYILPLALLVLVSWPLSSWMNSAARLHLSSWVLRIGVAVVFFIHGLECLWGFPPFVDLIIGSTNNLLGVRVSETVARQIMFGIGALDLLIAILLLVKPWRTILFWMAFWGTITAFSRMTTLGTSAYIEVLVRASHIAAPLAIYFIHYRPDWMLRPLSLFRKAERDLSDSEPVQSTYIN